MKKYVPIFLFSIALIVTSCKGTYQKTKSEPFPSVSGPTATLAAIPTASSKKPTPSLTLFPEMTISTIRPSPTRTTAPSLYTTVSAGDKHACGVTDMGGVQCWGWNKYGQLGDGTRENRQLPVNSNGLTSGVTSVAAGTFHTCALTVDGGVTCWGKNADPNIIYEPTNISGERSHVAAITAGVHHTCLLTDSGGVRCWGYNSKKQLGIGTDQFSSETPMDVVGLTSGVKSIAAGSYHTCAVMENGGVKCWGLNGSGQLGDGTNYKTGNSYRDSPVDVIGLTSGAKAVAAGYNHTCAVLIDGSVKCWGANGLLGNGKTEGFSPPVTASGLTSGATAVTAGDFHTCAVMIDGGIKCWGANVLGAPAGTHTIPVDIDGWHYSAVSISAGSSYTCALTAEGRLYCWGSNIHGQLGDGTMDTRATPVPVGVDPRPTPAYTQSGGEGRLSFVQISAGYDHTCAVTTYGGVKCWGRNWYGQLGDGTDDDHNFPMDVIGLTSGVAAVEAGQYFSCALTNQGGVQCWGLNSMYQLGDGWFENRATPADVSGLTDGVLAISVGNSHACALTTSNEVMCWGRNESGELGDGSSENRRKPVAVIGLAAEVEALSAGKAFTCVIISEGGVKCWGGRMGQFGLIGPAVAIDAGINEHACMITANGGAQCWGSNSNCELGNGTYNYKIETPVVVTGMNNGGSSIAAGGMHSCMTTASGRIACWGAPWSGQLGTRELSCVVGKPWVYVDGIPHGAVSVTAGYRHTCAVMEDGQAKCWGENEYGQLGDGTTETRYTPVNVMNE
jgi:alpha-tubulin suppressor-like RCC1 family protein